MTKCVLAPESQHKLKGLVSLVPFSSLTQISATQRSIQSRKTHTKYLSQSFSFGDDLAQLVTPKKNKAGQIKTICMPQIHFQSTCCFRQYVFVHCINCLLSTKKRK